MIVRSSNRNSARSLPVLLWFFDRFLFPNFVEFTGLCLVLQKMPSRTYICSRPHSTNYGSVALFLINDIDALVKLLSKL